MFIALSMKPLKMIIAVILIFAIIGICLGFGYYHSVVPTTAYDEKGFIKWVDFSIPSSVMEKAMNLDIKSQEKPVKLHWIELLSYLAAKNGGKFNSGSSKQMDQLVKRLENGENINDITKDMKYYPYYLEAYTAVLSGFLGKYQIEVKDPSAPGGKSWKEKYGLMAFSPIAKGYSFSHCSDFGNSRSYGYKRKHLGNDLMGNVGAPIIAVEGGVVEAVGWNIYGGWRIGIRSFDKKRYYYYAHLRKNFPYQKTIQQGSIVQAGDVIGYLGQSGYSTKENTNNIQTPHLHFGMQLIFDESQKEGPTEIWIDVYDIVNLLQKNRSEVFKQPDTKEFWRVNNIKTDQPQNVEQPPATEQTPNPDQQSTEQTSTTEQPLEDILLTQ